jgi:hypothetical protein
MLHPHSYLPVFWGALALATLVVIARGCWLYRASLGWPTVDGTITRIDIQRKRTSSGPYFSATFTYEFRDSNGHHLSGTWHKNFSSEPDARDFAARELPVGKVVVVRFNPRDPTFNDLELDSWTYTNDRPTSLNI